ncbi:hypothetical protein D3C81_1514040 [compost metagenome]
MKKRKLLGIGLLSAMLLSVGPSTYADKITSDGISTNVLSSTTDDVFEGSTITVKDATGPIITPFSDLQIISAFRYTSKNNYEKSFTLVPSNGTYCNIWIQNLGTATLSLKIFRNGTLQLDVPIAAGTQKTVQIYNTVTADYSINVNNSDGADNDFNIAARQFL